jgi:hypothetical protein
MFLDDKLLEISRKANIFTSEGFQKLNVDICDECQEYYLQRIHPGQSKKEAKVILDRTFNLFDSFVRQAKNSGELKLDIIGEVFEKNTFKHQFMKDEKRRIFYEGL